MDLRAMTKKRGTSSRRRPALLLAAIWSLIAQVAELPSCHLPCCPMQRFGKQKVLGSDWVFKMPMVWCTSLASTCPCCCVQQGTLANQQVGR